MGKLVFGMMQSLDGYVAGGAGGPGSDGYVAGLAGGLELPPPGDSLSRHFNDHVRGLAGSLCGRRMYEVMRYWDEDQPDWDVAEHDFAVAQPLSQSRHIFLAAALSSFFRKPGRPRTSRFTTCRGGSPR